MDDPWSFGWTQLLTIVGFCITSAIAIGGFRSFKRWKREKIEEKKIEIAFEALSLAYEAKYIFSSIRSPIAYEIEWKEMENKNGESSEERRQRGSYYAILRRLTQKFDFFDRIWRIQPKFMSVFGEETEIIFDQFHEARALVTTAARALTYKLPLNPKIPTEADYDLVEIARDQYREDLWGRTENDRVEIALRSFREGIEKRSRAVIDRTYKDY
jgi:hypothetical protein